MSSGVAEHRRTGAKAEASMDIYKMLAELREEHEQIKEAILALERLARSRGYRRGRPPFWSKQAAGSHFEIGRVQQTNLAVRQDAKNSVTRSFEVEAAEDVSGWSR